MLRVKIDRVAPPFELPASTGGNIASWDFKAQVPLILFFPHAGCDCCRDSLLRLKQDFSRYQEHRAQVLALAPLPLEECTEFASSLRLPFPLLADRGGVVRGRYLETDKGVGLFVLDRYGEPYGEWVAAEADALPPTELLVSALELTEIECPECGAPEWS